VSFLPLVNLWKIRSMIFHLAVLNIKMRFKNTYLGFLWAALEPLLYFIVLYVVFNSIRDRGEDFAIYLITGVMFYHIFSRGTSGGLNSLTGNSPILKSLNIRKEIFPVVATVAIGLLAFVDAGVFFGLMPIFQFTPSWTLIFLPIPIFLLLILILGISYLLSIVTVYVKDIHHLWLIFVHALIFVSPIFWFVDDVEGSILLDIQKINPLGQLIEIAHKLVMWNEIPSIQEWMYTSAFVFAIFAFGYAVFHKYQIKSVEEL